MTSERRIAASRANGRKSRGPRTKAGKSRSSRNALRHGLSTMHRHNLVFAEEIGQAAKALCGGDDHPVLFQQALVIAECDLVLRCVRAERVGLIERLRDATAIPLARPRTTLVQAEARFREAKLIDEDIKRLDAWLTDTAQKKPGAATTAPDSIWRPYEREERDEYDAFREAMPDLTRLVRYERRAWSRRKRAIRDFIKTKSRISALARKARDL